MLSSNAFIIWCCIPISRPPRVFRRFKRRSCWYFVSWTFPNFRTISVYTDVNFICLCYSWDQNVLLQNSACENPAVLCFSSERVADLEKRLETETEAKETLEAHLELRGQQVRRWAIFVVCSTSLMAWLIRSVGGLLKCFYHALWLVDLNTEVIGRSINRRGIA